MGSMRSWVVVLAVLVGCGETLPEETTSSPTARPPVNEPAPTEPPGRPSTTTTPPTTTDPVVGTGDDADRDGFATSVDCDDTDPEVHPEAHEACDGRDSDCSGGADRQVVTVGGHRSFRDLQHALDAARPGDEVLVCPGTYDGPFFAGTGVTLRSAGGPEHTTLRGDGRTSVLKVIAGRDDVVVEGFTLTGGGGNAGPGGYVPTSGGAAIGEVGDLLVEDCVFEDNAADADAGGLAIEACAGEPLVRRTTLAGNRAGAMGGGLHLACESGGGTATVTLEEVTIEANEADTMAGGAYAWEIDVVADDATVIRDNVAHGSGGGLKVSLGTWTGGRITTNEAEHGGGAYVIGVDAVEGDLGLRDVLIEGNTATVAGGGVLAEAWKGPVTGLALVGNHAPEGGGLRLYASALTLDATTRIAKNDAATSTQGGGVLLDGGSSLSSQGADLGTPGVDDNAPQDVLVEGRSWSWDGAATFTCLPGGECA